MKTRLVFGLVSIALLLGITAATGLADPNLTNVGAHRHFIVQPDGSKVSVGPELCGNLDNPGLQQAFNQFHRNHHVAGGNSIGPVAPGLHNGQGAEIAATPC